MSESLPWRLVVILFICASFSEVELQGICDDEESLWNEEENEIFQKIAKAEAEYKPCIFNNGSCFISTIKNDLKPYTSGISKELLTKARKYFQVIRYQLVNHTLYRDENCNYPARCNGNEYFLRQFTDLPDFELLVNVYDWALDYLHRYPHLPVFSFSKTADYGDIMYPAWSFWSGGPALKIYPTGLGRWDLHYESLLKEAEKWSWSNKKDQGFFRGSRTSEERDELINFSRRFPKDVDAQYTKNQAFKSKEKDTLGAEPAKEVPMEHNCQYKYLFNFRGVAASFRFKYLFMCGSLVFHVSDDWKEFFYSELKPWIHYIPLTSNYTIHHLRKLIKFFKKHDDVAQKIATRGHYFVRSTLKMTDVVWYWKTLLQEYTKLINFNIERNPSLIEIS